MNSFMGLIVKVTRNCNLKCSYCHDRDVNQGIMPFNVIANLIAKALRSSDTEMINFIWHGGEPLLLGMDFFKKIIYMQNQVSDGNQFIFNTIQTNSILIDDSWAKFLKKYNFSVGLSLDGPRELHDMQRPTSNGIGSYEKIMQALNVLNKNDVNFGILSVITNNAIKYGPKYMWNFLLEKNIKNIGFLPQRPNSIINTDFSKENVYITLKDYNNYLKALFDLWYQHDDPSIDIRNFHNVMEVILGVPSSLCSLGGQCIGQYFAINPNGDVYQCDRYANEIKYKLGNILYDNLQLMRNGEKISEMKRLDEERISMRTGCKQCNWFPICRGGCPYEALIDESILYEDICGNASLIAHICEAMTSGAL